MFAAADASAGQAQAFAHSAAAGEFNVDAASAWAAELTAATIADASPWLAEAAELAVAEANYYASMQAPSAELVRATVDADGQARVGQLLAKHLRQNHALADRWSEEVSAVEGRFTTVSGTHFRREAVQDAANAGRADHTLLPLSGTSTAGQIAAFESTSNSDSALPSANSRRGPIANVKQPFVELITKGPLPIFESPNSPPRGLPAPETFPAYSTEREPPGIQIGTLDPSLVPGRPLTARNRQQLAIAEDSAQATTFQEVIDRTTARVSNTTTLQAASEYTQGFIAGFKDSVLDTLQLAGSLISGAFSAGKYLYFTGLPNGMLERILSINLFNYDPIAQEQAAVERMKELLVRAGVYATSEQAALDTVASAGQLSAFIARMRQYQTEISEFLDRHGEELTVAILGQDFEKVERLKSELSPELQGAVNFLYSNGVKLAEMAADKVSPYHFGYLAGLIIYEVAEDAAITAIWTAATVGTGGVASAGAPALIAARAANVVRKIKNFEDKLPPGVRKQLTDFVAEAIWWGARKFEICFVAGTPVHTPDGLRAIETTQPGDWVWARPENDPRAASRPRRVRRTFTTHPDRLYHVVIRDTGGREETLSCTGEHPFYVVGRNTFVAAKELRGGDRVSQIAGGAGIVVGIQVEAATDGVFTTYNFEVEEDHTYFVGESGVWVHNSSGTICGEIAAQLRKRDDIDALMRDPVRLRDEIRAALQAKLGNPEIPFDVTLLGKHEDDIYDNIVRKLAPKTAGAHGLAEIIESASGWKPKQAGDYFGWIGRAVTKRASDFTKDDLIQNGFSNDVLERMAEAYEAIAKMQSAKGNFNPSASSRAQQLREIIKELF